MAVLFFSVWQVNRASPGGVGSPQAGSNAHHAGLSGRLPLWPAALLSADVDAIR